MRIGRGMTMDIVSGHSRRAAERGHAEREVAGAEPHVFRRKWQASGWCKPSYTA